MERWSASIVSRRSLLRYVCAHQLNGKTFALIESSMEEFVKFYNKDKPHTSLKGLTPSQAFYKSISQEAA